MSTRHPARSLGVESLAVPNKQARDSLFDAVDPLAREIEDDSHLTRQEKDKKLLNLYINMNRKLDNINEAAYAQDPDNEVLQMLHSGARATKAQVKQLMSGPGLVYDAKGNIVLDRCVTHFPRVWTLPSYGPRCRVRDWYDPGYYGNSPEENPTVPGHGKFRVIRGGGWHTGPYCSRIYFSNALPANWVDFNVGFRCARSKGESAAHQIEQTIDDRGIEVAVADHRIMSRSESGLCYFDESEFNELGYRLLKKDRTADTIEVLKLNAEAFPHSFNAHDSLGEACIIHGDPRWQSSTTGSPSN